ncbi:uncharacterized protein LOC144079469 [Stigmatopora argus]
MVQQQGQLMSTVAEAQTRLEQQIQHRSEVDLQMMQQHKQAMDTVDQRLRQALQCLTALPSKAEGLSGNATEAQSCLQQQTQHRSEVERTVTRLHDQLTSTVGVRLEQVQDCLRLPSNETSRVQTRLKHEECGRMWKKVEEEEEAFKFHRQCSRRVTLSPAMDVKHCEVYEVIFRSQGCNYMTS